MYREFLQTADIETQNQVYREGWHGWSTFRSCCIQPIVQTPFGKSVKKLSALENECTRKRKKSDMWIGNRLQLIQNCRFFGNLSTSDSRVWWQTFGQKLIDLSRTFRSLCKLKVWSTHLNHPVGAFLVYAFLWEILSTDTMKKMQKGWIERRRSLLCGYYVTQMRMNAFYVCAPFASSV